MTAKGRNSLHNYIRKSGLTQEEVAKKIGIGRASLSRKINGSSEFYASEIRSLALLLKIPASKIRSIFLEEE